MFCFLPSFQASTQWRNRADEGHAHAFRLPGVQPCGPQPWPQPWGPQPWGPQQQRQPVRKQERASKTCGTKARTSFKNMRSLPANMSFFALSLQLRRGETDEDRRRKPKISKTRDKGWSKRTVNVCRINFFITWPLLKMSNCRFPTNPRRKRTEGSSKVQKLPFWGETSLRRSATVYGSIRS